MKLPLIIAALALAGCADGKVDSQALIDVACARENAILDAHIADGGTVTALARVGASVACEAFASTPSQITRVTGEPLTPLQSACSGSGPVDDNADWTAIYEGQCRA